jgi:hypothetical protein
LRCSDSRITHFRDILGVKRTTQEEQEHVARLKVAKAQKVAANLASPFIQALLARCDAEWGGYAQSRQFTLLADLLGENRSLVKSWCTGVTGCQSETRQRLQAVLDTTPVAKRKASPSAAAAAVADPNTDTTLKRAKVSKPVSKR